MDNQTLPKILTEEELQEYEQIDVTAFLDMNEVRKLIASHRSLLSANAELSFKNMKLKEERFDLEASVILNVRENKRLRTELEAFKHE